MEKFALYPYEFGTLKITYIEDIIIGISGLTQDKISSPTGEINKLTDLVYNQIYEYLSKKRETFDFKYQLIGTEFQKKVWVQLEKIPYGQTKTYQEIAIEINMPKSYRAVGGACNKNPLLIVVPCHRVIGVKGRMVGYGLGVNMKEELLKREGVKLI